MTADEPAVADDVAALTPEPCVGCNEYLCCYRTTHRQTGKPVGGEMLDAVEAILAARLAAVEAVRDHYAVLAGLPVHAADVVDRLDTALGGDDD